MLQTATDLKDTFRTEVDDLPKDDGDTSACLWADADIYRYMNSAAAMVARRVRSLSKIFSMTVTADEPMVRLPPDRILKVHRAYLQTARRDLEALNLNDDTMRVKDYGVTLRSSHWEVSSGTPTAYVLDYRPGYLRLAPIPTSADTLMLFATVLPLPLQEGVPLPFTDVEDVDLMLLWMRKLAYEKHDADTFDKQKSNDFESQFDARVREREPEFRRQTREPGVVRSSW